MAKKGIIAAGTLAKVFRWVEEGSHTGTLSVSEGKFPKYVFFDKGKIVHAHSAVPQDQLEAYLLRSGILSGDQIRSAHVASKRQNSNFLKSLISLKLVPKEQILRLKKQQVRDITVGVLKLEHGEFIFYPDKLPGGGYIPFAFPISKVLTLVEGGHSDNNRVASVPVSAPQVELPPPDSIFAVSLTPETRIRVGSLSSEEQDVMVLFNGNRPLAEALVASKYPPDWTRFTVRKLINIKLLQERHKDTEFDYAVRAHKLGQFYTAHEKLKEILVKNPNNPQARQAQKKFANDLLVDIKNKMVSLRSVPRMKDLNFDSWQNLRLDKKSGFILSRIDGTTDLKQLISMTGFSKGEICMVVYALMEKGLLTLQVPSDVDRSASSSEVFRTSVDISDEDEKVIQNILRKFEEAKSGDLYKILGVRPQAQREEIKGAFIRLSKEFHPDALKAPHFRQYKQQIDEIFGQIKLAYDTLRTDLKRAQYDESIGVRAASQETIVKRRTNSKAKLQYSIAMKCIQRRDWNRAIEFLRSAIDLEPDEPLYHGRLAELLSKNARWIKEAQDHAERAIKLDPSDPYYFNVLGLIHKSKREMDLAVQAFYRALDVDRTNEKAIQEIESITGRPVERRAGQGGQLVVRRPVR